MPFELLDVERHIKGLTDSQKRIWINVANSVLQRCVKAGGTESSCDGAAIRQASGVAKRNLTEEQVVKWLEHLPGGHTEWSSEVAFDSELTKFLNQYVHETSHNAKGIEIFAVGTWNGDKYTVEDLNHMVDAFGQIGFDPPLKLGHNSEQEEKLMKDGQPALGWIDHLFVQGNKLLANFRDMPKAVFDAIKNKRYRTVSSEIFWNFTDNGKKFPRVLKAVALLGADIPAVTTLKPIEFKWKEDEDLRMVDFNNEEFEKANSKHKEEKKMEEREKELKAEIAKLKTENSNLTEANKTLGNEKTTLEDTNKELTKSTEVAKTELSKRDADVRAAGVREFVGKMTAEGRLLPKHEKEVTALLIAASDEKTHKFSDKDGKVEELSQRETLERVFTTMPNLLEFAEIGGTDGQDDEDDHSYTTQQEAGKEVDRRTKVYVTKQKGEGKEITYADAMRVVLDKDSKLSKAYIGD